MLSPNWDISIKSLSSGLRKSSGGGSGKAVRARGDDIKETRPSKHNRANNRISAETMAARTGSAWGCARRDSRAERRSGHMSPSPTRKLCPVDSHLQMTNQFSPKVSLVDTDHTSGQAPGQRQMSNSVASFEILCLKRIIYTF